MNQINNHFFLDLYDVDNGLLGEVPLIEKLANEIVNIFQKGQITILPYFNGKVQKDGGISCAIIGDNFHFTCHTFSFKNTAFIDCYGAAENNLLETILKFFPTTNFDLCLNNGRKGNFGKHFIANISGNLRPYEECLNLVETIVNTIEMTPIYDVITNYKDESEFDILQLIAESHISIHRTNDRVVLDVFSCKNFDEQKVLGLLSGSVDETAIINRGVYYQ